MLSRFIPALSALNADLREAFLEKLRVRWTHTSTALEGNTRMEGEIVGVLRYGLTISGKPLADHNEVLGHSRARNSANAAGCTSGSSSGINQRVGFSCLSAGMACMHGCGVSSEGMKNEMAARCGSCVASHDRFLPHRSRYDALRGRRSVCGSRCRAPRNGCAVCCGSCGRVRERRAPLCRCCSASRNRFSGRCS